MLILIKVGTFFLSIIYFFMKLFPTKRQILIVSRQNNKKSLDIEILEKGIKEELPNYKVIVMTKMIENKIAYAFYLLKLMYYIARSKVVILDSYCLPISLLKHKKSLKVIQMWHAIGLMKKAGYASIDKEEGRSLKVSQAFKMHHNYDYAFASSKDCVKAMCEVFHITEDKITVKLLPRVDLLRNEEYQIEERKKIFEKYPTQKNKKNIVYIPTFRKEEALMQEKIEELVSSIDYSSYNLIIKLHPNSKITVDNTSVFNCKEFTSMEMLSVADYVISDYSSIIYEAVILKKPLYLYAFDLDEYEAKRGLFIDYKKEIPGIITKDASFLFQEIVENHYDYSKQEIFCRKYLDLSKKSITLDIIDLIKENL